MKALVSSLIVNLMAAKEDQPVRNDAELAVKH